MTTESPELARLIDRLERDLPQSAWPQWPGGWTGEIEAAVLDSVFSVRARYGREHNGVRGVVARWRGDRQANLNDLAELAKFAGKSEPLAAILQNRQRLSGGLTKAEGAALAARALVDTGIRQAEDVTGAESERRAWRSVRGLSDVTWSYVLMLLGTPGVKADVMVRRFVGQAIGRAPSAGETRDLVVAAAAQQDVSATALDHAIWSWQRRQRRSAADHHGPCQESR